MRKLAAILKFDFTKHFGIDTTPPLPINDVDDMADGDSNSSKNSQIKDNTEKTQMMRRK